LGDEIGELESLSVTAGARGHGVGTMLIDRARALLRERGVRYWSVAVVESNIDAVRLYEREGFQPYYRQLLGKIS
jgi:ribosomal protein S18 acetylase RimI-like enzyme